MSTDVGTFFMSALQNFQAACAFSTSICNFRCSYELLIFPDSVSGAFDPSLELRVRVCLRVCNIFKLSLCMSPRALALEVAPLFRYSNFRI